MPRRGWVSILALTVVVLITMANCRGWFPQRVSQASVAPVYAWVLCQECDRGERARVVALGDTAVPLLRTLLLDGPPAERKQQMEEYLRPLATPRQGQRPASPATIARVLSSYDALYRVRAASALSGIGGPKSLRALCDAREGAKSAPSVRQAIDTALARIKGGGTCP